MSGEGPSSQRVCAPSGFSARPNHVHYTYMTVVWDKFCTVNSCFRLHRRMLWPISARSDLLKLAGLFTHLYKHCGGPYSPTSCLLSIHMHENLFVRFQSETKSLLNSQWCLFLVFFWKHIFQIVNFVQKLRPATF